MAEVIPPGDARNEGGETLISGRYGVVGDVAAAPGSLLEQVVSVDLNKKSVAPGGVVPADSATVANRAVNNPSDAELVARVQQGHKADYQILVERYQQRAFSVAFQILKRHEDAQDVVQESFVKAYLSIASFQGSSSFFTWFYRIVVNMAIDYRRKTARTDKGTVSLDVQERDAIEQSAVGQAVEQSESPLDVVLRGEQAQQINQVLGEISAEHRAVIVLREVEGLRYEQIADVLGVSKGTVMSRLFYARKRLQQLLSEVWRSNPAEGQRLNLNTRKAISSKGQ